MPQKQFPFKVSTAKRLIGAVQRKGLAVGSVEVRPDGTIRVLAAPPGQAAPSEIDRDTNEWDAAYGKPAA